MWERLADRPSRETLASIVASRVHNNNGYLRIASYSEYQHPSAEVKAGEVIVDAGAHVGKVTKSFAKAARPNGLVYSFEPDAANYSHLLKATKTFPNVQAVKAGVWSKTDTLLFDDKSGPSAGHAISALGGVSIPVLSLDDFFHNEKRRPPSLLKFDIEGAEAAALEGATQTIRRWKPRLMVSVYHKPADLWELMEQIIAIRGDYKFYLGHHNFYHTETDLYAV